MEPGARWEMTARGCGWVTMSALGSGSSVASLGLLNSTMVYDGVDNSLPGVRIHFCLVFHENKAAIYA